MCESLPSAGDQDELLAIDGQDISLAVLLDQIHQNWALGDNAANDDLVMQIREHIRRRQAATQRTTKPAVMGGAGGEPF